MINSGKPATEVETQIAALVKGLKDDLPGLPLTSAPGTTEEEHRKNPVLLKRLEIATPWFPDQL